MDDELYNTSRMHIASQNRHQKNNRMPSSARRSNRQSPDDDYDDNPDGEATAVTGMANARPTL